MDRLRDYHDAMHIYGPYDGVGVGAHWVIGLVFLVLLALAVIAAVVVIVRLAGRHPMGPIFGPGPGAWGPGPGPHHALAELDLRYARGEIERNDYLQRRADLLGQPYPASGSPAPGSGAGEGSSPTTAKR
jgi:putative membrane protein